MLDTFKHDELDHEILIDLLTEVTELYEASEQTLIELELKPTDKELQRALFRSLHTIKGDLGLVSFKPLLPLLQNIEDLLDYLRSGLVKYTSTMSDLVLLTMDQVKQFVISCKVQGYAQYDGQMYRNMCDVISQIKPDNQLQHEKLLLEAVIIIAPEKANLASNTLLSKDVTPSKVFDFHSLDDIRRNDIILFRQLIQAVEKHRFNDTGNSERILKIALAMNHAKGNPVAPEQLMVASYLHSFGYGFLPQGDPLIDKAHVYKSAKLIEHLDYWNDAYQMIMQYKERLDGSGYPMALEGNDICDGAKILGIADSFYRTIEQITTDWKSKKHMKVAMVNLNKHHSTGFCPVWLNQFNLTMAAQLKD